MMNLILLIQEMIIFWTTMPAALAFTSGWGV